MDMTRRRFLSRAAAAAVCARAATADGDRTMLPIVDTHQHLWDLGRIRPPWLKRDRPLARNFVMKDYLAATRGLNVVKAVYMEIAVADADLVAEAKSVIELCRRKDNPTVAAVIGGRPGTDGFADYIARFKDSPYVKGVRRIVRKGRAKVHPYLKPAFVRDIRLLGEAGLSFDLCPAPAGLLDAAKLVERCPKTRFIVDHCGNADPNAFRPAAARPSHDVDLWRKGIDALAKHQRVICKISGIVARMAKGKWSADDLAAVVNHCLRAFGPDRVVFGSDWPVCTRGATLRQWVEALKQIVRARGRAERKKLFHDNAVAFYGLKPATPSRASADDPPHPRATDARSRRITFPIRDTP